MSNLTRISAKIKRQLFGILNFGHCDLFGICVLLFEISGIVLSSAILLGFADSTKMAGK
jgi:hypothetical protein